MKYSERELYRNMADAELRDIWQGTGSHTQEQRDMARAIVAGRASSAKRNKTNRQGVTTYPVSVRMTGELRTELTRAAKRCNMSVAEFIRMAVENEILDKSDD